MTGFLWWHRIKDVILRSPRSGHLEGRNAIIQRKHNSPPLGGHPMKLLRYGPAGQEKPGLLDRHGKIRDLSGAVRDIDGEALSPASLDRLRRLDPATLPLVPDTRLGPCVGSVSKIVAIGLNYRLHTPEPAPAIPTPPLSFTSPTSPIP